MYSAQFPGGMYPYPLPQGGVSTRIIDLFNIQLKESCPWKQLNIAFLTTQIWLKLGSFEKAKVSFRDFMKTRTDDNLYYKVVERYLELKAKKCSEKRLYEQLLQEFKVKKIVGEVCSDLSNSKKIFDNVKLPICPYCNDCQLQDDCITTSKIAMTNILYPIMSLNKIDQQTLFWVC